MESSQNRASGWAEKKNRIIMMILLAILMMSLSVFIGERKESSIIVVRFPSGAEIEAEVAGVIKEICVEDAQPVEFGQVLFRVDPNG